MVTEENVGVAMIIVLLQAMDWWTTRLCMKRPDDYVLESNPFGRWAFKSGGVTWRALAVKVLGGVVIAVSYACASNNAVRDLMLGAAVWSMLLTVYNNAGNVAADEYAKRLGAETLQPNQDLLLHSYASSGFSQLAMTLFVASIGMWVWVATARLFLFGAALADMPTALLTLYSAAKIRQGEL